MQSLKYTVKLVKVADDNNLEPIYEPVNIDERVVTRPDLSRPGLPLAGFFLHFENERIQLIGNMEHGYLSSLSPEERYDAIEQLMQHKIVALIVTSQLPVFDELYELAVKYETPLYRTAATTSAFSSAPSASIILKNFIFP